MQSDIERIYKLRDPEGQVRCVIDTDTFNEIDDQFAIVQALLSHDKLDLQAIYAAPFTNAKAATPGEGMELSHAEILRLLDRLSVSAEGLVFEGVREYVGPDKVSRSAPAVNDLIIRARACSPGEPLYVIAIAAISNVSSAILMAPDICDKIVVLWLGGHALDWPNAKEFNLRQDIGGAQVLFDCGVPLVLFPCRGVISHLTTTVPEIEAYVEPYGAIGEFLAARFKSYSDDHIGWSKEIWDMAPVAWLINPSWFESVLVQTPILTDQATWSVDRSRHSMRYIFRMFRDPIMKDFFRKLRDHHRSQASV